MHNCKKSSIFNNLFVLELANNHLGSLKRGLKIIEDHAQVTKLNKVKAAIKLQFRDIDNFIHKDYKNNQSQRYIKKTIDTKLSKDDFNKIILKIKHLNLLPMATPFDEMSVDLCEEFDLPIIKIASSDSNDWPLVKKIASTKRPTIISTGGISEKNLDDVVNYFNTKKIELAINHCVSLYPTEDEDLCLSQIDYLKNRYPKNIIGLSTHEYNDWYSSMLMSYAKGVRTWERHIDIEYENIQVSKYCSLPHQCDTWYKAFNKAKEMNGNSSKNRRSFKKDEIEYLDKLVRGVYIKKPLKSGYKIYSENLNKDFYFAIPLKKGQLSCREVLNGEKLSKNLEKDEPLMIDDFEDFYVNDEGLKNFIKKRGF